VTPAPAIAGATTRSRLQAVDEADTTAQEMGAQSQAAQTNARVAVQRTFLQEIDYICSGQHDAITRKFTTHSKALAVIKLLGITHAPCRGEYVKPRSAFRTVGCVGLGKNATFYEEIFSGHYYGAIRDFCVHKQDPGSDTVRNMDNGEAVWSVAVLVNCPWWMTLTAQADNKQAPPSFWINVTEGETITCDIVGPSIGNPQHHLTALDNRLPRSMDLPEDVANKAPTTPTTATADKVAMGPVTPTQAPPTYGPRDRSRSPSPVDHKSAGRARAAANCSDRPYVDSSQPTAKRTTKTKHTTYSHLKWNTERRTDDNGNKREVPVQ